MRHCLGLAVLAALAAAGPGCSPGRYSASGLHLPMDGNVERGKAAFVELGCNSCHKVDGVDLPGPTVVPPVPVRLGGQTSRRVSDGYMITAMFSPNYHLAPHEKGEIATGGQSRMPAFTEKMTVRQMVDIVAFMQSRYTVRRFTPNYTFE